jgi:hypothetical protein
MKNLPIFEKLFFSTVVEIKVLSEYWISRVLHYKESLMSDATASNRQCKNIASAAA